MLNFDRSKALHEEACQYLANGVSSGLRKKVTAVPLYFERAEGPYYYDVDGNQLLDYTLAWGPLIVGSNHPVLNRAITDQMSLSYTLGAQHDKEIALSKKMVELLPGVERVIFSNTGSEAVQAAFRIARASTGREKVVKFEGHYHGWGNNILVSYHPTPEQLGKASPTCGGQPASEYENTLVLPWNDLEALEKAFADHSGEIAAVISEPVLANSGSCMPKEGFLSGLIELCRKNGAISIFDEVITGFRLALGGAREYFNLTPDLSVYAKAMAGGFSMAAVGGSANVFDALLEGKTIHAGTYNGSSINLAASLATIEILSEAGLYEKMHAHGHAIRKCLEENSKAKGVDLVTTGTGTVFSVHMGVSQEPLNYTDVIKADDNAYNRFRELMLHEGVQLLPEGRWYVGATHGESELDKVTSAIKNSFEKF